jgi:hypothetical protein
MLAIGWAFAFDSYLCHATWVPSEPAVLPAIIIGRGCVAALVMVWLARGYGAIALMATLAVVLPHIRNVRTAAQEYPWRLWWIFPLMPLVFDGLRALVVYSILVHSLRR